MRAEPPMHQVEVTPIPLPEGTAIGFRVELPGTRLLAISTGKGYIMCGALDVELLNTRLAARKVVAGRSLGVRSFADLLEFPLTDVTDEARALGIVPGMPGRSALARMF
ncbi:MAG: DUF1805 domain-containing protein [Bacillota bacterium]